jgi:hypothetical protein
MTFKELARLKFSLLSAADREVYGMSATKMP